jgi:hypothetical protein
MASESIQSIEFFDDIVMFSRKPVAAGQLGATLRPF